MNWEMITAIGQMAAVFVGIPSVIYFAVQLREQTRERRQSAVNALTVQWGELTKALHENAEFTAVYLRGLQSFHDLDPVSKLRFSAFQNRFFKNFEGMYYSRREGILGTELWEEIGERDSLLRQPWPKADAELAKESEIEVPVQVNGKLVSVVKLPAGADEEAIKAAALADEKVAARIAGKTVAKTIVVKGKLVNLVVK